MTAVITIALISLVACLVSMFAAFEQRLKGNDSACATALLWAIYTFAVFAICLIIYIGN